MKTISDFMREILEVYEKDYSKSLEAESFMNQIKKIYSKLREQK